jgi:hypothetical protein
MMYPGVSGPDELADVQSRVYDVGCDWSDRVNVPIPEPISGGLMLSYRCTARCLHCMYACSPEWGGDWMSTGDMERILEGLAGRIEPSPLGADRVSLNHGLHFTGGEPFLNYPLLCTGVEMAAGMGIPSLFVETNGFWCVDDAGAREKLLALRQRGLHGILISVNPFYLEYVPFERTERCVRISLEVFGENTAVYQVEYFRRFRERGLRGTMGLEEWLGDEGNRNTWDTVEFFFMGRAGFGLEEQLGSFFPRHRASSFYTLPCAPPFLRTWHNHFDNYGNFIPGYCGGITLGNCRDLDRVLADGIDTGERPLLGFIIEGDFEGFHAFTRERGYREPAGGYFSKCHLCVDLRRHLFAAGEFAELGPGFYYEQL